MSVTGDGVNVGLDVVPSSRTPKTSMLLPFLSVTTSHLLSGEKLTWAGSTDGALRHRVEFVKGASLPLSATLNPVMASTPPPRALRRSARRAGLPERPMLFGNVPPEEMTLDQRRLLLGQVKNGNACRWRR